MLLLSCCNTSTHSYIETPMNSNKGNPTDRNLSRKATFLPRQIVIHSLIISTKTKGSSNHSRAHNHNETRCCGSMYLGIIALGVREVFYMYSCTATSSSYDLVTTLLNCDLQWNQVKHTPQESINGFLIQKLNPLVVVDFRLISALLHV